MAHAEKEPAALAFATEKPDARTRVRISTSVIWKPEVDAFGKHDGAFIVRHGESTEYYSVPEWLAERGVTASAEDVADAVKAIAALRYGQAVVISAVAERRA